MLPEAGTMAEACFVFKKIISKHQLTASALNDLVLNVVYVKSKYECFMLM